jgi:thioredoxin reductase (NADPH)
MLKKLCITLLMGIPFLSYPVTNTDQTEARMERALTEGALPLVIIGSGPAGATAGIYGALGGIPTTIIAGFMRGGQLMQTSFIENYPGYKRIDGRLLMETMHEQAEGLGATIIEDEIQEVDFSTWPFTLKGHLKEYKALAVIATTGSTPKKLGVPGEEEYWARGVSSCAKCDGRLFKNRDVVVVGGGDVAVEEATHLATYARSVTIFVRSNRMRAFQHMQEKLQGYPNIKVTYNKQVREILGDGNTVTGVELIDTFDSTREHMPIDGLFLAIGHHSNTELFQGKLNLVPSGHIAVEGRTQATSVTGVYAAGDVEDDYSRQAVVAAGHGSQAAIEAVTWLRHMGLNQQLVHKYFKKASDA